MNESLPNDGLLPWQKPLRGRCRARLEPNDGGYWGRCELSRGHKQLHALERGMFAVRWSTETWISEVIGS